MSQEIDIVDDQDKEWADERSQPKVESDDEQQQSYKQELTNLRAIEWLNEMTSDHKEAIVTIQVVDRESMKYIQNDKLDPSCAAQERPLFFPASSFNSKSSMRSTWTSMDVLSEE